MSRFLRVLTNDPDGEVLVHLGSGNYLQRFKIYVAHLREWREQFAKLESVDLRYDRRIIVNPDLEGAARHPALSAAAAKAAIAAGVKPAALVNLETVKSPNLHASVAPTLSQRTRKDGATSGIVNPATTKHTTRSWRWRKQRPAKTSAPLKPAVQRSPVVAKRQVAPAAQKPSPAILKGQATH